MEKLQELNDESLIIKGIAPFSNRTSSLFSALEALFQFLSIEVDYDYLLGISGRAFDLHIHPTGVYCEGPDECDVTHLKRAIELVGYSMVDNITINKNHRLFDPKVFKETVSSSISKGIPVLTLPPFFPKWGLIIGYSKDGSFISIGPNEEIVKMKIRKGTIAVINRSRNQLSCNNIIRTSFKFIAKQAHQKTQKMFWSTLENPNMCCGLNAFDYWIRHLEMKKNLEANKWNFINLTDCRYSALKYLQRAEICVDNKQRKYIRVLIAKFEQIHHVLSENLSLFSKSPRRKSIRSLQIDVLKKVRTFEEKVFNTMLDIAM